VILIVVVTIIVGSSIGIWFLVVVVIVGGHPRGCWNRCCDQRRAVLRCCTIQHWWSHCCH
jgi:hypothetical protein